MTAVEAKSVDAPIAGRETSDIYWRLAKAAVCVAVPLAIGLAPLSLDLNRAGTVPVSRLHHLPLRIPRSGSESRSVFTSYAGPDSGYLDSDRKTGRFSRAAGDRFSG